MTNFEKIGYEPERNLILEFVRKYNLKDRDFKVDDNGHVIKLNLNSLWRTVKLGAIPNEIGTFSYLQELSLGYNYIEKITNLEKLVRLQKLILSNNRIKRIEGLDNLLQLRELNLWNNRIIKIEGLENLSKLIKLNLLSNPLRGDDLFILNNGIDAVIEYCKKRKLNESYKNQQFKGELHKKLDGAARKRIEKKQAVRFEENCEIEKEEKYKKKIRETRMKQMGEDYKKKAESKEKGKVEEGFKLGEGKKEIFPALENYKNYIEKINALNDNGLTEKKNGNFKKALNIWNESIRILEKAKEELNVLEPTLIQKFDEIMKEINLNIHTVEVETFYLEGESLIKHGIALMNENDYERAINSFNMALKKCLKAIILAETYELVDFANKLYLTYSNIEEEIDNCGNQLINSLDKL